MRVKEKVYAGKFSFRFRVKIGSNNETEKVFFLHYIPPNAYNGA